MAYANHNQGVLVPYHQLIDPRSLSPSLTFVPGPPIDLINPRIRPVVHQLVPANVVSPFGFVLNPDVLVQLEETRSRSLLQFMEDEGVVPFSEEEITRKNAIEKLKQIVMEWIKKVACQRCLREHHITAASATVLTFGSYGLGVHNSESDIDAICIGPRFATLAEDFFIILHDILTSRPDVSEFHCIKDAKVPLMRFKLDGISIDLPYAQLKVMSVPENVDILNPYFLRGIDETSWRSLSGVHANKCILQLLPNMEVFQSLLRCVKLWAKRRGVYGNLLGFFGGVHLAVLVAYVCQSHPNASLSGLISSFFNTFAFWNWPRSVMLQDGTLPIPPSAAEIRSLMPIRLPCRPREYCHSNITESTFYKIRAEFIRGNALTKDVLRPDFAWTRLFEHFPYTKAYTRFIKICLSVSDRNELGEWVGWVKSRFRSLLVKVEELQGFCDPNPSQYADVNVADPNIVFYWGLNPGMTGFLDIRSVKKDFVKNITNGSPGPTGKITLSIVQASQLPKNARFESESSNGSDYLPSNIGYVTTNASFNYPSAGG
ncbi:Nuclear poly(A) polymerase 3 (PAP(III)) like [Actinidia chinensis var. chinensis]|uniref:polynucleotide adenylyltransferase n=1 Tax=Actinidia chinensis var. chinensis TaxID=1590841 RepID=A0A2R6PVX0_ACTCC|nr:Nuclear poly(A) polymerase 3 (PAP(III)) like [Actinidia chinensis var. chinensis]